MGRAARPSSNPPSRRSPNVGVDATPSIKQLERRFAKFRRDHPSQTRIPDTLRGAVLAAVRQGVTPAELRRCGLSPNQLEYWQKNELESQTPVEVAVQAPQIFSVVEEEPMPTAMPAGPTQEEQQLELRLNGWSIRIHRVNR